ncbi:MAG: UDP-N-acetylmuramoyl-tripeptide--D-alanyl-D-alanine ligase [Oscillospiraceae bacterium]|nr:UDP-N-acetylmuramoyl-tripeptide--D-alanyl-D-alanine ligase [Oscillospiraceae bacterium]
MPLLQEMNARMNAGMIHRIMEMRGISFQALNCENLDFSVTGFSTDTRTIQPGNCFIALKGENFDGNQYAQAAVDKGAVMCILSDLDVKMPAVPCLIVPDTVRAYGMIANQYLLECKAKGCKVVAVTGSSGKTTVKDMTAHVLAAKYRTYATSGNHNNHIGVPFTVLHMPPETEAAVIEMGMNHRHEIENLVTIAPPDLAVITNVGTAHIGNLGSQEEIFNAKLEITGEMDLRTGKLILPKDDPMLGDIWRVPFIPQNIRYITREGRDHAALSAEDITETAEYTRFTAVSGETRCTVTLPMTGLHNVTNALLAMEVGLTLDMTLAECAVALADFRPGAMRSEREIFGNLTLVRDFYNANPEAMRASLTALPTIANGAKTVAVLGNMNELGEYAANAHRELGAFCRAQVDTAYFCGDNFADFAAGYGDGAKAFAKQEDLTAALLNDLPGLTGNPCCMIIKASRGLKMENVYDAVVNALK